MFTNRLSYTESVHKEAKEWVAENLGRWKTERKEWFKIEMIPDELLPLDALNAAGGSKRRRISARVREIVGLRQLSRPEFDLDLETKEAWENLAEGMYEARSE